ncbi:MAG TPA: hypothetical protein VJ812_14400 [Gemmatimonadaceae bacterium]|jgi:intracellular sulfur oxidation DsrE/DsrF family protein|nr:hypothetical protein [Gemmatimonadaceae bacterium]
MPGTDHSPLPRRGFLGRLSAAAAGFTTLLATPAPLRAIESSSTRSPGGSGDAANPDGWLDRLNGRDRMLLHAHRELQPALYAAWNILTNGRQAYGVPEQENSVVVASHGPAIGGMFTDDIWRKFTLGERYKMNDPATGSPYTKNPFLRPLGGMPPDATVPDLMKRNVTFIVCNVAVRNLSRRIVGQGEGTEALHEELVAGLLPGMVVVPDLFVAISHAQKKGIGYIFID